MRNTGIRWAATAAAAIMACGAQAQLVDTMAAVGVADSLGAGSVSGGMDPAMLQGRANAAVGAANTNMAATNAAYAAPAPGLPGAGMPPLPGGGPLPGGPMPGAPMPGAPMPGGAMPGGPMPGGAGPGAPGAPGAAPTPTPIPMFPVLTAQRVFDAVTGVMLEDAMVVSEKVSEQHKYFDDGIHDNGIAGDDIFGNVETITDKFIGAETNGVKNRMIRVVRQVEAMSPMQFFRYHVATMDPRVDDPRMPNLLEKEKQRDNLLADWNNKFLADYRVDQDSPQSKYFDLYVPRPPQPPRYPVPPGYVSPQKMAEGPATPGAPGAAGARPNIYNGDPVIDVPGVM